MVMFDEKGWIEYDYDEWRDVLYGKREQVAEQAHLSEWTEAVNSMDNGVLLNQTLYLARGDDYDGCFTENGQLLYKILESELSRRFLGDSDG